MSGVYTVLATSKGSVVVIETYAGVQSAMTRGWHVAVELASQNTDWVSVSPKEETLPGGTVRWVLLDTSHNYVAVYYSHIDESLKSRKDRLSLADRIGSSLTDDGTLKPSSLTDLIPIITFTTPLPPDLTPKDLDPKETVYLGDKPVHVPGLQPIYIPSYDIMDRTLPAGFDLNNRPILMGDMLDDPYRAKAPENLTLPQQWALVIARAKKDPDWRTLPKGYSGYCPHAEVALPELEAKTDFGKLIMEGEIATLQAIYDDAMLRVNV